LDRLHRQFGLTSNHSLTLKHTRDQPGLIPGLFVGGLHKIAASPSLKKTMDIHMPSKNERVELEMKIIRCRQLMRRVTDDEFLKRLREQVAELEQKLREIDE
jgi:hypothetical protein